MQEGRTQQIRHKCVNNKGETMFQRLIDKKIFIILCGITLTSSLFSQEFLAGYTVAGTRTQVIMPIDITLTDKWDIYKSEDKRYPTDTLFTKNKSVFGRLGFSDLGHGTAGSYIEQMVSYGYTKHTINNRDIITQKSKARDGSTYYNIRMAFDKPKKLFLFVPMFPYDDFKGKSLEDELKELVNILSTVKISTVPNAKNSEVVKNAESQKYADIQKEIDNELATATLIDDDGTLKDVNSFCLSLNVIPFKYSQDKKAPQWIKDYAHNAISMCKGKLYTSALTKHLSKQGASSCSALRQSFSDDFFIKGALRKSGDIKMWDTLQKQYKNICK